MLKTKIPAAQVIKELKVQWNLVPKSSKVLKPALETKGIQLHFDGTGCSPGRVASLVAKKLIENPTNKVIIDNLRTMWFKGSLDNYVQRYTRITALHHHTRGPFYSRRASALFSNMVRRMLPKSKPGAEALRRFRVGLQRPSLLRPEPVVRGFSYESLIRRLNGGIYIP